MTVWFTLAQSPSPCFLLCVCSCSALKVPLEAEPLVVPLQHLSATTKTREFSLITTYV